jgi:hypothetical protein
MSLEMLVLIEKLRIPQRNELQRALKTLGIPLELDRTLDLNIDRGFSPSLLNGVSSGFEISAPPIEELIPDYPPLKEIVGRRDWAFSFRWGGHMRECACVLGISAALIKLCDATSYYPADDITYDLKRTLGEVHDCLKQVGFALES